MKRYVRIMVCLTLLCASLAARAQVLIEEGFEHRAGYAGGLPPGWTFKYETGLKDWVFQTGGHKNFPDTAASGTYNACFSVESYNSEKTKLVSPSMDMRFVGKPRLRFKLVQDIWQVGANKYNDELRVYYKTSFSGVWKLAAGGVFTQAVTQWTEKTVMLDPTDVSATYYIAFEGKTNFGYGTCIDDVIIDNAEPASMVLNSLAVTQASTMFMASGSTSNPILKLTFNVTGNINPISLQSLVVTSLNTSDADLLDQGVKVFYTSNDLFSEQTMLGTAQGFVSGQATFSGLGLPLHYGDNYIWVTYDLKSDIDLSHVFDAKIQANAVVVQSSTWPATDQSPPGERTVFQTVYSESFEGTSKWNLHGFQEAAPTGKGGNDGGNPDPSYAAKGSKVLGTALTGTVDNDFNYIANLGNKEFFAISPTVQCTYLKDVRLRFQRWLNLEMWDDASVDVSVDGQQTWITVWESGHVFYTDNSWIPVEIDLSAYADRHDSLNIRFTLGYTNNDINYSGWNIDDVLLTANYLENDIGATLVNVPASACGLTTSETIVVKVHNYSAFPSNDTLPVGFSLNGGLTYTRDTIFGVIPVGGDTLFTFKKKANFSLSGYYNTMARTMYPGDEDTTNDVVSGSQVFSIPTYSLPYATGFELSNGYWTAGGNKFSTWQWGKPSSSVIKTASSGYKAWKTNLTGIYELGDSSYVTSPCFSMVGVKNPVFDFKMNQDLDSNSTGVQLQYSLDGGLSWSTVPKTSKETNWYNVVSDSALIKAFGTSPGWSDSTGRWVQAKNFMPTSVAGASKVSFRFVFASLQHGTRGDGFAFDDVKIYPCPSDIGVYAIRTPSSSCELSGAETVTITIKNYGIDTLAMNLAVPLGLKLGTGTPTFETFVLPSAVNPGDTLQYTFTKTIDMSHAATYKLAAFTKLAGDVNFFGTSNDTAYTSVEVYGMPDYTLGPDVGSPEPTTVTLNAGAGFKSYAWSTGQTSQQITTTGGAGLYRVTVTNNRDCQAIDSLEVVYSVKDLMVSAISGLTSACSIPGLQSLSCTIKNNQNEAFLMNSTITVSYQVNDQTPVVEQITLASDLNKGETVQHTFATKINMMSKGVYTVVCYTSLFDDIDKTNDANTIIVENYGDPVVSLGNDTIHTSNPLSITLDAGANFQSYLWSDGSTNRTMPVVVSQSRTYRVTVTALHGCGTAHDSVVINTRDLAADSLVWPVSSCILTSMEQVKLRIKNNGTDILPAGTPIPASYTILGKSPVHENIVLASDLIPGSTALLVFSTTVDLSVIDDYIISSSVNVPSDILLSNNRAENYFESKARPVFNLGPDTLFTNTPESLQLSAFSQGATYLWFDGFTGSTYQVFNPQTFMYSVTATKNGCVYSDSMLVWTKDLTVSSIDTTLEYCQIGTSTRLKIQLTNSSQEVFLQGEAFVLGLVVDTLPVVYDTIVLPSDLFAGQSTSLRLSKAVDLSVTGAHNITVFLVWDKDVKHDNDSITSVINVYGYPVPQINYDTLETNRPDTVELKLSKFYKTYHWYDNQTSSNNETFDIQPPYGGWYHVVVTVGPGCSGRDSMLLVARDIAIGAVYSPVSKCTGRVDDTVSVTLINTGVFPIPAGTHVSMEVKLGGVTTTEDLLVASELGVGSNIIYTFKKPVNTTAIKSYDMQVRCVYANDVNAANDVFQQPFATWGLPGVDLGDDTIFTLQADTVQFFIPSLTVNCNWTGGKLGQTFRVPSLSSARYDVLVTDIFYGCESRDSVFIVANDLAIDSIINPTSRCLHLGSDSLVVQVRNTGFDLLETGSHVVMQALVDSVLLATETVTVKSAVPHGQVFSYTFNQRFTLAAIDTADITVRFVGNAGVDTSNDSKSKTVLQYGLPSIDLGVDTLLTTLADTLRLGAPSGFEAYWWPAVASSSDSIDVTSRATAFYVVTVKDSNQCFNSDSVLVLNRNIGIERIVSPASTCTFDSAEAVVVSIRNLGDVVIPAGTPVEVGIQASSKPLLTETVVLAADLARNAVVQLPTHLVLNLAGVSSSTITARVAIRNDALPADDSTSVTIVEWGVPVNMLDRDVITTTKNNVVHLQTTSPFVSYLWDKTVSTPAYDLSFSGSGYHYVQVVDSRGCVGKDSVMIMSGDLGLGAILNPVNRCIQPATDSVVVELVNYGGDDFPAASALNLELWMGDTLVSSGVFVSPAVMSPGDKVTFSFAKGLDISGMPVSSLDVRLTGSPGVDPTNDTSRVSVREYGLPEVDLGKDTLLTTNGPSVTLYAPEGYVSYAWTGGAVSASSFTVPVSSTAWYVVTVTDLNACSNSDSVLILNADLSLSSVVAPASACQFTSTEPVVLQVMNMGDVAIPAGTPLHLSTKLGSAAPTTNTITLDASLAPGARVNVSPSSTLDLAHVASTRVEFSFVSQLDANNANNVLSADINQWGLPSDFLVLDTVWTRFPNSLTLKTKKVFQSYLWSDASTLPTLSVSNPGSAVYVVTVVDNHGCTGSDTVVVVASDLALGRIVHPVSACVQPLQDSIVVEVINTGGDQYAAGTKVALAAWLGSVQVAVDSMVFPSRFAPGDTLYHTFSKQISLFGLPSASIKARLLSRSGVDATNDAASSIVVEHGLPVFDLGYQTILTTRGDTVDLVAPPGYVSYRWTDGSTLALFKVPTAASRQYGVTITDSKGCSASDSVMIMAGDIGLGSILNPVNRCVQPLTDSVSVEVVNVGGDVLPLGTSLGLELWSGTSKLASEVFVPKTDMLPGDKRVFSFASTISLRGSSSTPVEVRLTGKPGFDASNDTLRVAVREYGQPVVDLGPDTLLTTVANTKTLYAPTGYKSYAWTGGSSASSFKIPVVSSARYIVTVTDFRNCKNYDSVQVINSDLALAAVEAPVNSCSFSASESVVLRLTNQGDVVIPASTPVYLTMKHDAKPAVVDTVLLVSQLAPGASQLLYPRPSFNLAGLTSSTLACGLSSPVDAFSGNNALSKTVVMYTSPVDILQFDTIKTISPDTLSIRTKTSFASYAWFDASSAAVYPVASRASSVYRLTVTDDNGCKGSDSTVVISTDLGLGRIIYPTSRCQQMMSDSVVVEIINTGGDVLASGASLQLDVAVGSVVASVDTVVLQAALMPGDTILHTFKTKVSLAGKPSSDLRVRLLSNRGIEASNDMAVKNIKEWGFPSIDLGIDTVYSTRGDTLSFTITGQYTSYRWTGGSTLSYFDVPSLGSALYQVTVTDANSCSSVDSVRVINRDLALDSIVAPVGACKFVRDEVLTLRVANRGDVVIEAGTPLVVSARVGAAVPRSQTIVLASDVLPGQSTTVTTTMAFDFAGRPTSSLTASISLDRDATTSNNTTSTVIREWGFPADFLPSDTIKTASPDRETLSTIRVFDSYLWDNSVTSSTYRLPPSGKGWHVVRVVDSLGCPGVDSVFIVAGDVALGAIASPGNTCLTSGSYAVDLSLINSGSVPLVTGARFPVRLKNDVTTVVTDTIVIATTLEPGDSIVHTFSKKVVLAGNKTTVLHAFLLSQPDYLPANDSTRLLLYPFGKPRVDLGVDTVLVAPDSVIVFSLSSSFSAYRWSDGSTGPVDSVRSVSSSFYYVTVSAVNGCQSVDSVYLLHRDLAIVSVISPASSCIKLAAEPVVLKVINKGDVTIPAGRVIEIGASLNGQQPSVETVRLVNDVLPGETVILSPSLFVHTELFPNARVAFTMKVSGGDYPAGNAMTVDIRELGSPSMLFPTDSIKTTRLDTLALAPVGSYVSYAWSNGSTAARLFPLYGSGLYQVTVTDTNGCSGSGDVFVLSGTLGLGRVRDLANRCVHSGVDSFSVEIINGGPAVQPGHTITLDVYVASQLQFSESFTLQKTLNQSAVFVYPFKQELHLADSLSLVTVVFANSQKPSMSDTSKMLVREFGIPVVDLGPGLVVSSRADTLTLQPSKLFASYVWNTGDQTASIVPSRESSLYVLTATDAHGCSNTDSVRVLNQDLMLAAIQSPRSGCAFNAPVELVVRLQNNGDQPIEAGTGVRCSLLMGGLFVADSVVSVPVQVDPGNEFVLPTGLMVNLQDHDTSFVGVRAALSLDANRANDAYLDTIVQKGSPLYVFDVDTIISLRPDTIELSTSRRFSTYLWDNGSPGISRTLASYAPSTYRLTVTDQNGCSASDSIYVFTSDISLSTLASPVSSCMIDSRVPIRATIRNNGLDSLALGTRLMIEVRLDDVLFVRDTLVVSRNVPPAGSIDYLASRTFDLSSVGQKKLTISMLGYRDIVASNNHISSLVQVWEAPQVVIPSRYIFTRRPDTLSLVATGNATSWLWNTGQKTNYCDAVAGATADYIVKGFSKNGCWASDTVTVVTKMLAMKIISPVSKCSNSSSEKITLKLFNLGTDILRTSDVIDLRFVVNDTGRFVEKLTLARDLPPADSLVFSAQHVFNASALASYSLSVAAYQTNGHVSYRSDSSRVVFSTYGFPQVMINDGKDTIRTSRPLTLSVPAGYSSYRWSSGETTRSCVVTSSGKKYVTVTAAGGCVSRDSVLVEGRNVAIASIVSPLPALCLSHASGSITLRVVNSGLDTLLKGTSVPVTFAVAGGVPSTELLTLPKTLVPDSSIDLSLERKFNFSVAGQFSLTYRVSLPNDIDTSDNRLVLPLSVFPLPVVSFADKFDTISVQLPYQLKAKEGFSTYKWSTGDNLSSLVVSQSGTYTLTVVDKNGCEASRKIVLLSVTSSPFIESGRYSVSPNPAHDYVSLTMNDGLPIEHVKLFNARAVMVSSLKVDNLPSVSLFVGDLPAGTYVIHVRTKNNEIIVKFLKQ